MSSVETVGSMPNNRFRLLAGERLMLAFTAILALLSVALAGILQRDVVWLPFATGYAATLGLAAVGAYIRQAKSSPRIALAVVGFAIYAGFAAVSMVFVFLLLPLGRPLIDPTLIGLDHALGYNWPSLVAWLAEHPTLGRALGFVYLSSQQQLILVILLLAVLARETELQRFLAVGMITLAISVAIWWVVPSVGPSAFMFVPADHIAAINLHFTPGFGEVLRGDIQHGPGEISPETVTGIIAFPSYHIIMAAMVVFFSRGTPAFVPFATWNIMMIPATLAHGAHHLVDLVGGVVVFALGVWIANRLIRPQP